MAFNFRDKVKDSVTGFTGIVIAIHSYMNGCLRLEIQSEKLDKDGRPTDPCVFDAEQLELVKAAKVVTAEPGGGPRNDYRRPKPPRRR